MKKEFTIEDLSTRLPFRDAVPQPVRDADHLREIVLGFAESEPRVLRLNTTNFEVYFGAGNSISFIECFGLQTGQAKYPLPKVKLNKDTSITFNSGYQTATPPSKCQLSLVEVLQIATYVMAYESLPEDWTWELSLDWYAEREL